MSEADLIERVSLRRTCSNQACGRSYHLRFEPPRDPAHCDVCNAALYQRKDDAPEAISTRLETYRQESAPLRSYYERTAGDTGNGVLVYIRPNNIMTKKEVLEKVVQSLSR